MHLISLPLHSLLPLIGCWTDHSRQRHQAVSSGRLLQESAEREVDNPSPPSGKVSSTDTLRTAVAESALGCASSSSGVVWRDGGGDCARIPPFPADVRPGKDVASSKSLSCAFTRPATIGRKPFAWSPALHEWMMWSLPHLKTRIIWWG